MRTKHDILILFLLLAASSVCAQNADRVRINEVVVNNQDGYVDDYGQRVPWFELFNSSFNNANIEGCYLSNDINQPKMYMIPKGDKLTEMEKRQHVVFFADGKEERGTFHLNFTLDSTARNFIYLFDANGKTLIDSVCVPVLDVDHSWGHPIEGDNTWQVMERVTPKANNRTLDTNEKMDKFSVGDPVGIGMSLTAMGVVFSVLILLAIFFKLFTKSSIYMAARRAIRSKGEKALLIKAEEMSGEMHAAISMALYELDNDVHDMEDMVLTISRTRRAYSPWSSKIYGLRQMPNRK
jgi:Na+-transporting methylmalonyl-CoA/oxaloacetate decarboxylase gamma subunit